MSSSSPFFFRSILLMMAGAVAMSPAAEPEVISYERLKNSSAAVQSEMLSDGALQVELAAGAKGSPGVIVLPSSGSAWDFSKFSRIEAVVQNTGDHPVPVSLRVDNQGHWKKAPWSSESVRIQPGQTSTLVVFFGFSHGMKPSFALDRSQVTQFLFFAPGADQNRRFVVKSISAAGDPDETPETWGNRAAARPVNGLILGETAPLLSSAQLTGFSGAAIVVMESGEGLNMQFTGGGQVAQFRPLAGKWDLHEANVLKVEMVNQGGDTYWPAIQMDTVSTASTKGQSKVPAAAGEKTVIQIPFSSQASWQPLITGDGSPLPIGHESPDWASDEVTAISFLSRESGGEVQSFEVSRIEAVAATATFPEWIGKRPPVEGDWVQTLSEEFNGADLDESVWNPAAANHWDKGTGFSRDNVTVFGGVARLCFEHRTSRHNDDPEGEVKDYTSGFLDTFGKWKQRYGYFEARMKLPEAPGLWPAFWMMPDRGPAKAPRWKREETTNGGMEFDIMEHLSGWGPYRYNVAFHWDGYGKNHLSAGTSGIYFQTDDEGFFTTGLLWLPGQAIYYCNGAEVGRWESDRISDVPSILMFTHVSGGWDNQPIENAQLPADFAIDYVRCWQRRDLQ